MTPGIYTDTGPFSIVPEWLLDLPISDRAVRLYAVLARYADDGDGTCFPSRDTLARRLDCSRDSVDRAMRELVAQEAVAKAPQMSPSGDQTSNLYTVFRVPLPGRGAAATQPQERPLGGREVAAQNENHELELKNELPSHTNGAKTKTRLPDDWGPSERTKAWCRAEFPEYATRGTLEHFRDHHIAEGNRKLDWDRAFQTWVRRQPQFEQAQARGPSRTYL